jgi:uncharacterized protein
MQGGYSLDPASDVLADPWDRETDIPLDGILERHQYPPTLTAFMALFLAFVLFQLVVSPIAVALLLLADGIPPSEMIGVLTNALEEHGRVILTANTIGQVLGLALPALVLARMHTTRGWAFLRVRATDLPMMLLALLGLAALLPVVQWLGGVNETLPLPETIRRFEQSQLDLIERVLMQDTHLLFNLLALALTPAICEELLFRGYVQRQSERGFGVLGGILFSGIAFGLYHLRLTQLLPLAVLGIYIAYVAWRTGSLWPAIMVHFANNAFAVMLGAYIARHPELGVDRIDNMRVPWYLVASGVTFFILVAFAMERWARVRLRERTLTDLPES